jgi:eukaryotic-like serine/threonine-protein kinase
MRADDVLASRYRLAKMLGKGGMAEVWQAHDQQSGRQVAMKFLRPAQCLDSYADEGERYAELSILRQRFRREAALLERLRHPGIPQMYGRGTHNGDPYIVMRLVEGVSLHDFLERHTPTTGVTVSVAAQITDALACAHALPVVHRDLKPHNVLIARDGTVVLIDFGIARPLGPDATDYTRQGSTVGSRGYQAPEQILERQVTPAADLYALGCILYRMLAGRPPFVGDGLPAQHISGTPLPSSVFAPHVPPELDELTLRLLAKDPQDRPASAQAVRSLLGRFLPGPGEPDPSPRFDPDPTAFFRAPEDRRQTAAPAVPSRPAGPGPGREPWLRRRDVEGFLTENRAQFRSGGADPDVLRIVSMLNAARRQWGQADPLVRSLRMTAADGFRILGNCQEAAAHYQEVVDISAAGDDPAHRADALEARLGLGECRIPFGDLAPALHALAETIGMLPRLAPDRARPLAARCKEVALELQELRYDEARTVLGQLGECYPEGTDGYGPA